MESLPSSVAALAATSEGSAAADLHPVYPASRRVDVVDVLHGQRVPDPYRWLEDAKTPEVQTWMKGQDDLARSVLAKIPGRDAFASRLRELFYVDDTSVPFRRGDFYFYSRYKATQEKWVVYFRRGKQGEEKVLLDPNGWGHAALGVWMPSPDGKRLVYAVHPNNADEGILYVMDVDTGKRSDIDVIPGIKNTTPSWTPRGDGFYYAWLPTDPRIPATDRVAYRELRFHKLGTDPKRDEVAHERTGDPTAHLSGGISRDGHHLVAYVSHGWTSREVYIRDLRKNTKTWTPLPVAKDAQYTVYPWQDKLYVLTNERAPNGAVYVVDPADLDRSHWKAIVPERKDATLQDYNIVGGRLALRYLKDVASQLRIVELDGRFVRDVQLPGIGAAGVPNGEEDEDDAYYSFSSYLHPRAVYSTSMATGRTALWSQVKVPVDPTPYQVEQIFFHSKDGTRVPMFVVHRKHLKLDGSNPTILYGYGGFQQSLRPGFDSSVYPWLERGGVYAVANLRGGSEYGEGWHRGGMGAQKEHVFEDFEAAAETLIQKGFTMPRRLAIWGGSNGGLLVGAALTRRPDLFGAVVCEVPLLDMVRYHLFGAGKTWISEYGSAEDPEQFKTLFAYSPYHHVQPSTRYPAVLLFSSDSDDRVDPMHARKFAAALQHASTGGPVLLSIEQHAGHGGADSNRAWVDAYADEYAFALWQTTR
jgi:prolyl oligopeptidase